MSGPLNLARQTPKLQILHETPSEKAVLVVYVQAEMMPARCLSPIPRSKTFPNTQTHSWMLRGSAAVLLASINESDLILGEPNSRPSLALPSKPGGWTTTSKSQTGYARYAHALKSRVYNKPKQHEDCPRDPALRQDQEIKLPWEDRARLDSS